MQSANKTIMFYDICRLCLDEPGSSVITGSNDICENIYKCTGIKIQSTDNLPQKVCSTCLQIVNNSIQLKLKASKNDKYLKEVFEEEKNEKNSSDDSSESKDENNSLDEKKVSLQYLAVRKDLFQSSPEVSAANKGIPAKNKKITIKNKKDGSVHYECVICEKTFDKWKKIYLHLRLHNKTLRCPLDACVKTFATKGDLEKHIRSHTGEKPYVCDECDKRFSQKGSLKSHKTTVHKVFFR